MKYSILLLLLLPAIVSCTSKPVSLGEKTVDVGMSKNEVVNHLEVLPAGTCEDVVFARFGISKTTPNLKKMDVRNMYEHESLLNGRKIHKNGCIKNTSARLPYTGYEIPFINLKNKGYFLKWNTWRTITEGQDLRVTLLFVDGALVGWSAGGEENRKEFSDKYIWTKFVENPFEQVMGQIR